MWTGRGLWGKKEIEREREVGVKWTGEKIGGM
jgi:hypothetical protein